MDVAEFTSTRHNPMLDPHMQIWEWQIPVYLFLGGLVAGIMILSSHGIMTRRHQDSDAAARAAWPWAPMLGVALLSLGMGALFLDLQHRWHVYRLYMAFRPTSPMSWGSWILLLVYPAMLAAAILHPPERVPFGRLLLEGVQWISRWMQARPGLVTAIGVANLFGGIALGIYTGILLSGLSARPLWNSAALGPLFLLSGLSTAAALMHLLTMVAHRGPENERDYADLLLAGFFRLLGGRRSPAMLRLDTGFLSIELATLLLFLLGLSTGSVAHRAAADLLLSGAWAPAFWCGVVISGILIPLLLQSLEMAGRIAHSAVPAVLVLGGGFLLRWVLVFAGQASHW